MTAAPPAKVFFIGEPRCSPADLAKKVTTINTKNGPFDCCFVVGNLLQEGTTESELEGIEFPIPTYFCLGDRAYSDKVTAKLGLGSAPKNLVRLGKTGALTTASGLKIGWIGGKYDEAKYATEEEQDPAVLRRQEAQSLLQHTLVKLPTTEQTPTSLQAARSIRPEWQHGLDVLLLSQAPPSIASVSKAALPEPLRFGPAELDEIMRNARPRYTVWVGEAAFWEREPFVWKSSDGSGGDRVSRSVMMAPFIPGNKDKKAKSLYAFALPAIEPTSAPQPPPAGISANPYALAPARGVKRPLEDQNFLWGNMNGTGKKGKQAGPPPSSYVCHKCKQPGHWIEDCPLRAQSAGCRRCGAPNHHVKDCPTPRDEAPPEGYVCKLCQQSGHWIQDCPQATKSEGPRGGVPPPDYKCNACEAVGQHYIRECPKVIDQNERKKAKQHVTDMECWFCLSGRNVAKHLVVAIESEAYVALPKGSLIPSKGSDASLVPGGGHVLIIPIGHHQTLSTLPIDEAIPIISEISAFKGRLKAMYNDFGAVPVTFEISRLAGKGGHAHIQVVPVPLKQKDEIKKAFLAAGEEMGVDFEANAEANPRGNYFKVELPDGEALVHRLRGTGFNLQFGRLVLAKLLGLESRIDWRNCKETDAQQTADATAFRKAFKKYT